MLISIPGKNLLIRERQLPKGTKRQHQSNNTGIRTRPIAATGATISSIFLQSCHTHATELSSPNSHTTLQQATIDCNDLHLVGISNLHTYRHIRACVEAAALRCDPSLAVPASATGPSLGSGLLHRCRLWRCVLIIVFFDHRTQDGSRKRTIHHPVAIPCQRQNVLAELLRNGAADGVWIEESLVHLRYP
jgi:hypothetical protein